MMMCHHGLYSLDLCLLLGSVVVHLCGNQRPLPFHVIPPMVSVAITILPINYLIELVGAFILLEELGFRGGCMFAVHFPLHLDQGGHI